MAVWDSLKVEKKAARGSKKAATMAVLKAKPLVVETVESMAV